ncbi:MAG: hypothetical protein WCJ30_04015 [Deltaproteobacteria bacterium]
MAIDLQKYHQDETCTAFTWRSLLVLVWHRSPSADAFETLTPKMIAAAHASPHRLLLCAIAAPGATSMDAGARDAAQRGLKRLDDRLAGAVNVITATGFAAAAIRGALTGLSLLLRPKYPTAFVGSMAEASAFVAKHWPSTDSPEPSIAELTEMLSRVAPT